MPEPPAISPQAAEVGGNHGHVADEGFQVAVEVVGHQSAEPQHRLADDQALEAQMFRHGGGVLHDRGPSLDQVYATSDCGGAPETFGLSSGGGR